MKGFMASIARRANYFLTQTVMSFRTITLIGVFILFAIVVQCITGTMLSFSLIGDPMLACTSRSTEDMGTLYTDDFF